ncbi:extracellular solute-binding protein [Paenibacillus cymbidii]|uniref:extracellular solute-binding protein n=1 Tax=Paenibacillus cymbidii TaxID=1639034 RepID=UPI0010801605|nr:extracellular solute-binding protein [Paenibacillus cymbidii]
MKRENEFRYTKLANALREQIVSGYIKPGQYLLSENELCRHYNLSRSSVRKALDMLFEEGLIVKRVGQGTVVRPDFVIPKQQTKTLRILASSPSYFAEYGMPFVEREFRRQFPHVDVKILPITSTSFHNMFEASRELGFQPDLLFVTEKQYQVFSQESPNDFVDLAPEFEPSYADMYPKLNGAFRSDGDKVSYAAPVSFSPVFLVCNPGMFARFGVPLPHPAWTKDEFITAAKMLTRDTDGDGIADTCGFSLPLSVSRWPAIAMRNGIRFQPDDDPKLWQRTLTFLHDILYRYRVATLANRTILNSDAFSREKAGMVLTTAIELTNWKVNGLPFTPKIAPMPFGADPSSLLIANAFMIPNSGEDIELARHFLRIALDKRTQTDICRDTSFLSVFPQVNESLHTPDDIVALGLHESAMKASYFMHEIVPDMDMFTELDREMDLFWTGLESADSFAARYRDILQQP